MPTINNAIPGVPSLARKRKALQRRADQDFMNLPNWLKTWTVNEAQTWIDDNVNSLAEAKTVLKEFARFAILMVRYHEKYEEE